MNKLLGFSHIESITLCISEEVDEVAGRANNMGVDRIDEVGDTDSEGWTARVYATGFTVGSLTRRKDAEARD